MPHELTQPSVFLPSFDDIAVGAPTTRKGRRSVWNGAPAPTSGRVARGERDALCIGDYLHRLCDGLARRFDRPNAPSLSCTVADHPLPVGTAVTLGLITSLLVSDAYVHGFAPPEGGRIAVSFLGLESTFELTIDDSGLVTRASVACRADGLATAALLVRQQGGRIETPRVVAGSRAVVTLPRRRNGAAR